MAAGIYDPSTDLKPGFPRSVRMLGAWIDTDGGARTETSKRI